MWLDWVSINIWIWKFLSVLYLGKFVYKIFLDVDFCFWFIFWCVGVGKKGSGVYEFVSFIFFIVNLLFYIFIDDN